MPARTALNGRALHASLPGGSAECCLTLADSTLVGRTPSGAVLRLDLHHAELHRSGQASADEPEYVYASSAPEGPSFITRDARLHAAVLRAWPSAALRPRAGARRSLSRSQAAVLACVLAVLGSVLAALLLLGPGARLALRMVPRSVDERIGRQAMPIVLAQLACGDDDAGPDLQPPVEAVLDRLVAALAIDPFQFRVTVCASPVFNAFALPGGQIVITTRLLAALDTSEELAAVLAHEMNHVLARHTMEMTIRRGGARFLVDVLSGGHVAVGMAGSVWGAIAVMSTSRDKEAEADRLAIPLLVRAGVDPNAMLQVLGKLAAQEPPLPPALAQTSTARLLEKMRSHPHTAQRIGEVSALIAAAPPVSPLAFDVDYPALRAAARAQVGSGFSRLNLPWR